MSRAVSSPTPGKELGDAQAGTHVSRLGSDRGTIRLHRARRHRRTDREVPGDPVWPPLARFSSHWNDGAESGRLSKFAFARRRSVPARRLCQRRRRLEAGGAAEVEIVGGLLRVTQRAIQSGSVRRRSYAAPNPRVRKAAQRRKRHDANQTHSDAEPAGEVAGESHGFNPPVASTRPHCAKRASPPDREPRFLVKKSPSPGKPEN